MLRENPQDSARKSQKQDGVARKLDLSRGFAGIQQHHRCGANNPKGDEHAWRRFRAVRPPFLCFTCTPAHDKEGQQAMKKWFDLLHTGSEPPQVLLRRYPPSYPLEALAHPTSASPALAPPVLRCPTGRGVRCPVRGDSSAPSITTRTEPIRLEQITEGNIYPS